jgi:hypothetical protein
MGNSDPGQCQGGNEMKQGIGDGQTDPISFPQSTENGGPHQAFEMRP